MTAKHYPANLPAELQLVTLGQLLEQWNTSASSFWRIRKRDPSFPKPARLKAGKLCWRVVDIQRWLEQQAEGGSEQ